MNINDTYPFAGTTLDLRDGESYSITLAPNPSKLGMKYMVAYQSTIHLPVPQHVDSEHYCIIAARLYLDGYGWLGLSPAAKHLIGGYLIDGEDFEPNIWYYLTVNIERQ